MGNMLLQRLAGDSLKETDMYLWRTFRVSKLIELKQIKKEQLVCRFRNGK